MLIKKRGQKLTKKRWLILIAICVFETVFWGSVFWRRYHKPERTNQSPPSQTNQIAKTNNEQKQTSVAKPTTNSPTAGQINSNEASLITVVVNKKHQLPSDYIPKLQTVRGGSMLPEAAEALEKLFSAAEAAGHKPKVISSYRSFANQQAVYSNYVSQYGQAQADTFSARPGYSEHQTGLAVDVGNQDGSCDLDICFGTTQFGKWLSVNAASYGFIIRYPDGRQTDTGYQYEPWHLRFIGTPLAVQVQSSGQTLDQYFNIEAGSY